MVRYRFLSLIILVMLIFLPVAAFSFNQSDLAGNWYGVGVVSGDNGTGDEEPRWEHFDLTINATGQASGTGTDPGGTGPIDPFTLSLSNIGIISDSSNPTGHGVLNEDKNFFAFTDTNDGYTLYLGIKRERTTNFLLSELEGDWRGCQVTTGDRAAGDDPRNGYGEITLNDSGVITSGTWYSFFSSGATSVDPVSGVTLSITTDGILSDTGNPSFYGVLSDDSNIIAIVDTSGGNELILLTRDNDFNDFIPADVQGTWTTHAVVSGDRPDDEPAWVHSVLIFDNAGNYSGTGTDPSGSGSTSGTVNLSTDGFVTVSGETVYGFLSNDRNLFAVINQGDGNELTIGIRGGAAQVAGNIIINPGFETGDLFGWTAVTTDGGWLGVMSGTTTPNSYHTFTAPPEGTYAALFDPDDPGHAILYQDFYVPTGYSSISLSATIYVENLATEYFDGPDFDSGVTNQKARLDLMDPTAAIDDTGAGILSNLFITNPGDSNSILPTIVSVDLTPYAGQTVRLRLGCVTTVFYLFCGLDNIEITAITPPGSEDGGGGGGCFISSVSH